MTPAKSGSQAKTARSLDQGTTADYASILVINEAAVPAVSSISRAELMHLHQQSVMFRVAREGAKIGGFLIAMNEEANYDSLNYQWFKKHYPQFIYVDRIAIAPDFQRRGLGREFYADVFSYAAQRGVPATCEVNLRPPNPESLAFHYALGFIEVGQQDTEGGKKRVALLSSRVPD